MGHKGDQQDTGEPASDLAEHKRPYAHDHAPVTDLVSAIRVLRPTALIGAAAQGGAFTREAIEEMARLNERPVVFALSNPTSKSECTAAQAYKWSGGRALFASGSPFEPVMLGGHTLVPRQGNNCYVFPGVGLGVIAVGARRITNEMFMAAARALSGAVSQADIDQGSLYPPLENVRQISARIAAAVAEVACAQGHATVPCPDDLPAFVTSKMYEPDYPVYVEDPKRRM